VQIVRLNGTGDFHGSIYAPTASVILNTGLNVFGSVVSNSLTVRAGGRLHFDRAFSVSDDENGTPHLLGWHIIELPNVGIVRLRYDALADLISHGITPIPARSAHYNIGVVPGTVP
jgi:hypothetical protein